jgi:hypothetical protein
MCCGFNSYQQQYHLPILVAPWRCVLSTQVTKGRVAAQETQHWQLPNER